MYGLILIVVTGPGDSATKSVLRSDVLKSFGLISYSLYLFHPVAKGLVFYVFYGVPERLQTMSDALLMAVSAAVAIVCCTGLYRFVERPAQLRGRTFSYNSNAQDSDSIAVQRR
ncbi:hypothetical protein UP10_35170 [Bradyrhizobium sp. LTSPM299]|nr:hypothetical protein UP10_35170 [Bradyrhizobium sp. LTSPM299]